MMRWGRQQSGGTLTLIFLGFVVAAMVVASVLSSLGPPDTTSCHYHYDHTYAYKGQGPAFDMGEDKYCEGFNTGILPIKRK